MMNPFHPILRIVRYLWVLSAMVRWISVVIAQAESLDDREFSDFGIYAGSAPRAEIGEPVETRLPHRFHVGERIALIGNTLLDREQLFGFLETGLHQVHPNLNLVIRNFAWSADAVDLQPRPDNFADLHQHLTYEKIDTVIAAFGFNESFAGRDGVAAFEQSLRRLIDQLRSSAYNGVKGASVILLSPIPNENISHIPAADSNNQNIILYAGIMKKVAAELSVGYIDLWPAMLPISAEHSTQITINGIHLNEAGYELFGKEVVAQMTGESIEDFHQALRLAVIEKNRQFFRRYRPLNTYYYTGARNKSYGYLDFLPAMKNFEIMTMNRDRQIWSIAQGMSLDPIPLDETLPDMPATNQSRGANEWLSPADEREAFRVDPRFDVQLFASEVEFPDLACPIQMRWDTRGRMWVSCSTTYPHVYPGNEPNDKIIILEDTDLDGKADKSTVFVDSLQIPLSFELGDGGVYVSEEPHLVFLKDTDGDDRADFREVLLTGFGCEDSHHALHDFIWTPDGDLLFRESIFHNSQVETPYGPVRARNSAWFQLDTRNHRLLSFGSYPNTNPWGVTFDPWGYHIASHPIFAAAFHAPNPAYPSQHPPARGIPAYSGVCGHEIVDFPFWPADLQGCLIKVRYKPTNRVEIHRWSEANDHFKEDYLGDMLFSTNLSFIPVDLKFGPRGDLYVVDWYNPVKGHMQYSLRDERRDRHSGRIWRIVPKGVTLPQLDAPHGKPLDQVLEMLKAEPSRLRYMARMELRERPAEAVIPALDAWVSELDAHDTHLDRHRLEALWMFQYHGVFRGELWKHLISSENQHARAAAVRMMRKCFHLIGTQDIAHEYLKQSVHDSSPFVRMEAAIAASYTGTQSAFEISLDLLNAPMETHLKYAVSTALGSEALRRFWQGNPAYAKVTQFLTDSGLRDEFAEPAPDAQARIFDADMDKLEVTISCVPERMRFTKEQFSVRPGQSVKVHFTNPDATDHNWVLVQPGSVDIVGSAANEMAKNPANMASDFIPDSQRDSIIAHSRMIGPTRKSKTDVIRFKAPVIPGDYPYICTFPGHWVIMKGLMRVEQP